MIAGVLAISHLQPTFRARIEHILLSQSDVLRQNYSIELNLDKFAKKGVFRVYYKIEVEEKEYFGHGDIIIN